MRQLHCAPTAQSFSLRPRRYWLSSLWRQGSRRTSNPLTIFKNYFVIGSFRSRTLPGLCPRGGVMRTTVGVAGYKAALRIATGGVLITFFILSAEVSFLAQTRRKPLSFWTEYLDT